MVQYRNLRSLPPMDGGQWAVVNYAEKSWTSNQLKGLLHAEGIRQKSSTRSRLQYLLNRSERGGLFYYEGCTKIELLAFCKQRNITQALNKPSKASLVQQLEDADDNPTFHKFRDLPAELRLRVYDLYFNWLANQGIIDDEYDGSFRRILPARLRSYGDTPPPPLTQVKPLQNETLPLFYKIYELKRRIYCPWQDSVPQLQARFFLHDMPDEHFIHFRILHLTIHSPLGGMEKHRVRLRLVQSVRGRAAECHIEKYTASASWRAREDVEPEMDRVMKMVSARPDNKKLLKSDIAMILCMFPTDPASNPAPKEAGY